MMKEKSKSINKTNYPARYHHIHGVAVAIDLALALAIGSHFRTHKSSNWNPTPEQNRQILLPKAKQ